MFGRKEICPSTSIDDILDTFTQSSESTKEMEGEEDDIENLSEDEKEETEDDDEYLDEDISFVPITETLKLVPENRDEYFLLPTHRRCASHTLNLVATSDVQKITDRTFNNLLKTTEEKLKTIWRKQSSSSKASDYILAKVGGLFVLPNATRWNSHYDALDRMKKLLSKRPTEMRQLFEHFGVAALRPSEEEFIKEYVRILFPLTRALDILQADKNVSIGYLLPTIVILQNELKSFSKDSSIKHCKPLITAIENGVNNRFEQCFFDPELRLAAMTHPRFKLSWVVDGERDKAEKFFKDQFKSFSEGYNEKELEATNLAK